jgi:hypothetical protein
MTDSLGEWGLAGSPAEVAVVDDLLLIATELLSNAVKFSSGDVALVLTWLGSAIRVSVTDGAPLPAARRAPGPESSGGRGLAIVAALSRRWGQTPYEDGCKKVWAEVSVAYGAGAGGSGGTSTPIFLEG